MNNKLSLPKSKILRSKITIQSLFENADNLNIVSHQYPIRLVVQTRNETTEKIELTKQQQTLFVVSKKFLRNATDRNRVRRQIKEVARINQQAFPVGNIAIMYTANTVLPFNTIKNALLRTLEKINNQTSDTSC